MYYKYSYNYYQENDNQQQAKKRTIENNRLYTIASQ